MAQEDQSSLVRVTQNWPQMCFTLASVYFPAHYVMLYPCYIVRKTCGKCRASPSVFITVSDFLVSTNPIVFREFTQQNMSLLCISISTKKDSLV
jgi:hypothetical protein